MASPLFLMMKRKSDEEKGESDPNYPNKSEMVRAQVSERIETKQMQDLTSPKIGKNQKRSFSSHPCFDKPRRHNKLRPTTFVRTRFWHQVLFRT